MSEFRRNQTWAKALFVPLVILSLPILVAILWFIEEVEQSYEWLDDRFPGGAMVAIMVFAVVFVVVSLFMAQSGDEAKIADQGEGRS